MASRAAGVIVLLCALYVPEVTLETIAKAAAQSPATLREICKEMLEGIIPTKKKLPNKLKSFLPRESDTLAAWIKIRSAVMRSRVSGHTHPSTDSKVC